jgi:hypothetical protein
MRMATRGAVAAVGHYGPAVLETVCEVFTKEA